MKKALIIFAILFALTFSIPFISSVQSKSREKGDEIVTIFNSQITAGVNYHLPF